MNKKLILTLVFLALALVMGAGYYFLLSREDNAGNTVADNTFGWKYPVANFPITGPNDFAYSEIRDPGGIPKGLPVRLQIPAIGVNSAIEDALITPDGKMDVPAGSKNVAWFSLGPTPGKVGSAVIGGHFGIRDNIPFVFYELDKLKVGDKVYIINDKDETIAFVVRSIKLFERNADATNVFTSNDGLAHLNLITCEGLWNRVNDSYPQRRVVFTEAVPKEEVALIAPSIDEAITKAEDIATFYRTLAIGATGVDVTTLQTFLVEKGFLIMPLGVAYGYFGPLTSTAIGEYQVSSGLERVGVFGPLTRAKVLAELGGDTGLPDTAGGKVLVALGGNTGLPNTGSSTEVLEELGSDIGQPDTSSSTELPILISIASSSDSEDSPSLFQTIVEFIKSLFTTSRD